MELIQTLVPLIIVLPLLGALVNTFAIRDGRRAGIIASAAVLLGFVLALVATATLAGLPHEEQTHVDFTLWQWIEAGRLRVPFGFLFDPLSAVMVLLITGVGGLIHVFSIGYMAHDPRPVRYFVYMNLFVTAMLLLVLANNYLLLFLGWEGVGLCSYLLIGHSFERSEARYASMKAFVVNRMGDFGLMLAILALFQRFGSLNFGAIFPRAAEVLAGQQTQWIFGPVAVSSAIAFLMLIGVTGKSAQIPLWVWLPDAMAGPTPASALIHAATMVTSGVYLIVRSHAIFALTAPVSNLTAIIGVLTAFVAASIAIGQYDIKRVLAFSTVSQLGFMVAAAGMGAYTAAMFHLLTHGVFKALLFLAAGSVIHGTHETQDMRRMGGLRNAMPQTFRTYIIGTLALAGIPIFAGFFSKDEIIGAAFHGGRFGTYPTLGVLLIITAALTAFYMGRQVFLIFWGEQRDHSYHPHESEPIMTVPLWILAVGATLAGMINFPGLHFLDHFLEPVFEATGAVQEPPEFDFLLATITVVLALGAIWVAYQVYGKRQWKKTFRDPLERVLGVFFEGFEQRWYADDVYESVVVRPFKATARFLARILDPLGIDGLVNGAARLVGLGGQGLREAQTGYVRSYTLVFLIGVLAVIGYFGFMTVR
ncbi:MAG TPA: NADH-quinone oxidoreductase subunit L [Herpetosiphonaceae bacterium]